MAAGLRPVKGRPGEFQVAGTGEVIKILEYRDDQVYDTIELQAAAVTTAFGTETKFFDVVANKWKRDTNVLQQHKLPQGWELRVMKLGFYVHSCTGNTPNTPLDMKKIYENATLNFNVNQVDVADGWCLGYQAGVGLAGNTVEVGAGIVSPGTPSVAAAPTLLVPQKIDYNHYIGGSLRFDPFGWTTSAFVAAQLSAGQTAKLILRGYLKRTVTK